MSPRIVTTMMVLCLCLSTVNTADGQATTGTAATATATATTPTPAAPSKGTQIGQIISDAINTAFPVIGRIMDLFKGGAKKATKDEVADAVKKAQEAVVTQAKQKVQPVAIVSKELKVIQAFSTAGVSAGQNLAAINRLLAVDKTDYGRVGLEWKIAKNYLGDVLVLRSSDIEAVRDPEIRARIIKLQMAHKDLMERIDSNITDAQKKPSTFSKAELQSEVTSMSALLDGFDTLAAVELSMLQADIDDLAKWANTPAGVIKFAAKKPSPRLLKIIDNVTAQANASSKNK